MKAPAGHAGSPRPSRIARTPSRSVAAVIALENASNATARSPGARSAANTARSSSSGVGTALPNPGPREVRVRLDAGDVQLDHALERQCPDELAAGPRVAPTAMRARRPAAARSRSRRGTARRRRPRRAAGHRAGDTSGSASRTSGRAECRLECPGILRVVGQEVLGVGRRRSRSRRRHRRRSCGSAGDARPPTGDRRG